MTGKARGDVTGSADDTSGNGVAYGNSDSEPHTKDLQQFAFFLARERRACGKVGGERVRGGRQGWVSWKM
jgi:hypothetical protein